MESSRSPAGSVKRHGRNISYGRPRKATRDPLEEATDPLAEGPQSPPITSPSDAASTAQSTELAPQLPELDLSEKATAPSVDLSFLKLSSNYHQLGTEDIPEAYINSTHQPPQDTPLADLIQHGHFRRAAGASLVQLSLCPPEDTKRILQLLYTRLACLVLIARPDLASAEGASLTDYLARNPPGAAELLPLIPWELRILLVRLQSITAADNGRRGIMSLYSLAAEVRTRIKELTESGSHAQAEVWYDRLNDLGLRVADTLVEMGELETATRHLESMVDVDGDELAYRKTLLRLRVGDVTGAQVSISKMQDPSRKLALDALLDIANNEVASAIQKYQSNTSSAEPNALSTSNLAVGLLYTGKLPEARSLFQQLLETAPTFPGLLFNLGTVYELCTDQSLARKAETVDLVAGKQPQPVSGGWEKPGFDFKL